MTGSLKGDMAIDFQRRAGAAFSWFRALPGLVQIIALVVLVGLALLVVNHFTNVVGSAVDSFQSWRFNRRDAKDVERIDQDEKVIAQQAAELAAEKKVSEEWKTKYDLSIRAYELDHKQGADLDAAIEQQYQAMQEHSDNPDASDVSDAELLRRLREHQTKRKPR